MTEAGDHKKRLLAIAKTNLAELSDEEVLRLLAERKQLQELEAEYEQAQKEQEARYSVERRQADIEEKLTELNKRITPDKADDDLLKLIKERQGLEAERDAAAAELTAIVKGEEPALMSKQEPLVSAPIETPPVPAVENALVPAEPLPEVVPAVAAANDVLREEPVDVTSGVVDADFGRETITQESGELNRYLGELNNNAESLGTFLDGMPFDAKQSRAFMLEVAKIDPAYAMHYADKDTLKKDESFNLALVSMRNTRNTGTVLSEMLPEARTAKVVMAAIRTDYRNVRFALPQMEGYEAMLELAKKLALEKIKELKDSVDATFLLPKVLQKDKVFMAEVEKIIPKGEKNA